LLVVLDQPVDVLHLRAGALGDAAAPAGVEDPRVAALLLGHARDDSLDAGDLLVVDLHARRQELAGPGDHLQDLAERADLLQLPHLDEHVLEREVAEVLHLPVVVRLEGLRLLDQREDVAHAEDAPGDAVGVEGLQPTQLLARAREVDRLARHVLGREGGAAAGVAVELRHDQARHAHALVELASHGQRLLARHRVDHEHLLGGRDQARELGELVHQRLVDLQAPGGVDDDEVAEVLAQVRLEALRHLRRPLAVHDLEDRHTDLVAEDLELLARGGALGVGGDEEHASALALVAVGELARGGRLAGALQAHQQPDVAVRLEDRLDALAAEGLDQLLVDDRDYPLVGLEGHQDLRADRLLLHAPRELAGDLEVDVGLQQRDAHLAQGRLHVRLGEASAAPQAAYDRLESVAQALEHGPKGTPRPRAEGVAAAAEVSAVLP